MTDPTAVMGRRILAYIIDSLIIFAIFGIAFFAVADSNITDISAGDGRRIERAFDFGDAFDEPQDFQFRWDFGEQVGGYISLDDEIDFRIVSGSTFWAVTLVGFAASVGFLVLMQGVTGRTPGKAMLGLRTVDESGRPSGFGKAVIRWLVLFVDAGFLFLPGLISSLTSKGHRRLGDMAAKTYVVAAAAAGQPVVIGGGAPAPGAYTYTAPPPAQPSADSQWDASRNAWIRWDGTAWTQFDPATGSWRQL